MLENLGDKGGADLLDSITISSCKIMRVFPKVKGGTQIVKVISGRFKELFSAEAKASYIWLLGEYCKRVENSGHILEHFTKSYFSQPAEIQLRILSTGIKMYLFQIEPMDTVMSELIQKISEKSTNSDLRDRGYIYWRLLYKDDEKAKEIIFNEPQAMEVNTKFSKEQIEEAKRNLKLGGKVTGILGKSVDELFKGKESVTRVALELDSEVIVKHGDAAENNTQDQKQEKPKKAEESSADQGKQEVKPASAAKQVKTNEFDFSEPADKQPAARKLGSPDVKTGALSAPKQAAVVQQEINLLEMDFDSTPTAGDRVQAPPQPATQSMKASSKPPQQMEENLFEDEDKDKEEDLFEGEDDSKVDCKFISMPEEVRLIPLTADVRKEGN